MMAVWDRIGLITLFLACCTHSLRYTTYNVVPITNYGNSSVLPLFDFNNLTLSVDEENTVLVSRHFTAGDVAVSLVSTCSNTSSPTPANSPINSRIWVYNIFTGLELNSSATCQCQVTDMADTLTLQLSYPVLTSQGALEWPETHSFKPVGSFVQYSIHLGNNAPDLTFYLTPAPNAPTDSVANHATTPTHSHNAHFPPDNGAITDETHTHRPSRPVQRTSATWTRTFDSLINYNVADNWTLTSEDFQANALAISLQGLLNREGSKMYLTYPEDWSYTYTGHVRAYIETKHNLTFQNCSTLACLLEATPHNGRYVLYDPNNRASLVVALTAAGLHGAVVATASQEQLLQQHGYTLAEDLSTRYTNQTNLAVFTDARSRYFSACNSTILVWLGGACSPDIRPGIADYGVMQGAFFVDLSTDPNHTNPDGDPTQEYALSQSLVEELAERSAKAKDFFYLQGWHSYCKDEEHTFTTLASQHGGVVHGLNTNPNLSFMNKLPVTDGFKFKNHFSPTVTLNRSKVYVTLVQTDGLGLGAWTGPARGTFPYAWEVTLPDLWIQPSLLEMFYAEATPNDFFVAALGGPGYMYINAVPETLRARLLQRAQQAMKELDLEHMVTFDASRAQGEHTVTGNTNLDPDACQAYFTHMPNTSFWLNGYGATFTATQAPGTNQTVLSFDYYLDPGRTVAQAVGDLTALATVNAKRPYFLPVHVREFASADKVAEIAKALPEYFAIVPVDVFQRLVVQAPTFRQRFG
eukprot:m.107207 g.107207  ORF g.107207 m.107207 type:complete len:752 (+) comp15308_c0_seq3:614-2869(+)